MANVTITVLEADGTTQTDAVVLGVGRQAEAASKSIALATEDKAVLDAVAASLATLDNVVSGNEAQVDIVAELPAGTNNIGDVDVVSLVPGTGATALGKAIDTVGGATDTGVAALAIRDDALTTLTPADGDWVPLRVSSTGALHVTGSSGATEYTEDAAAASDPVGGVLMAIRRDTLSTSEVSADGDNIALKATNKGKLHVAAELRVTDSAIAVGSGTVDSTTIRVVNASDDPALDAIVDAITGASPDTGGDIAHDAVDSGKPMKMGAKAIAALSGATLVAAADRTDLYAGLDGVLIIRPHANLEDIISGVAAITDGSSTSVIASSGAGVKNYITSAIIANSSATAVTVDLRDGAAGTVKATLPVPANTSGVVCNLPVPLPFSAATAVCADPSAAASTITVTLIGFKSKV
jgi:hypothetical protein